MKLNLEINRKTQRDTLMCHRDNVVAPTKCDISGPYHRRHRHRHRHRRRRRRILRKTFFLRW